MKCLTDHRIAIIMHEMFLTDLDLELKLNHRKENQSCTILIHVSASVHPVLVLISEHWMNVVSYWKYHTYYNNICRWQLLCNRRRWCTGVSRFLYHTFILLVARSGSRTSSRASTQKTICPSLDKLAAKYKSVLLQYFTDCIHS